MQSTEFYDYINMQPATIICVNLLVFMYYLISIILYHKILNKKLYGCLPVDDIFSFKMPKNHFNFQNIVF